MSSLRAEDFNNEIILKHNNNSNENMLSNLPNDRTYRSQHLDEVTLNISDSGLSKLFTYV